MTIKMKWGAIPLIFILSVSTSFSAEKKESSLTLSLDDSILLAVRSQPNIESTRLRHLSQKFNLWVQQWKFYPHPGFEASYFTDRNIVGGQQTTTQTTNVSPSVSWSSPIGTQVAVTGTNTHIKNYNPGLSLQVSQPLMRGFGKAIVESALNNAKDSEYISRVTIENTIRKTVTDVINAYLNVVLSKHALQIDQASLALAEKSVVQTKLFIKAGHKAGNELVTVEANVASAKTQLENDQNNLTQSIYALLSAIGLDPNTPIQFSTLDLDELLKKYNITNLDDIKSKALSNDIQYRVDQITLHGQLQRDLATANDNTRWKLNLTANVSTGDGIGTGQNAGLNSLFNGFNQKENVGLTLTIPLDDQEAKQTVMNAKIAIREAELGLKQEKWSIETNAINAWNSVSSAKRALQFAVDAETLQEKTYQISYQKYLHGLIDSLQLQAALQSLTQAKQTSLNARVNYLRSLVNLDLIVGNTLKTWKIGVRV